MSINKEILHKIVDLFVIKERRNRFKEFIESDKSYRSFLLELLNDPRNLKPECIIELPNNQQTFEIILQNLHKLGAGKKAYLVSADYEVDGKIGSLEEVLDSVSSQGSIIYCLESNLGYYEGHHNWRYILRAV